MNRNWFRNIVRGVSLTSALFVFQACYGTPQDVDSTENGTWLPCDTLLTIDADELVLNIEMEEKK